MLSNYLYRGIKNSSYLAFGNITAQIITLAGFVYITTMLGPENYGKYSVVISFIALFGFISLPGIDRFLLIECSKSVTGMSKLMSKYFSMKILFSLLSMIVCLVISYFMPYSDEVLYLIFIFSFTLIFNGLIGYFGTIFQVHEEMKYLAFFRIFRMLFFTTFSIIVLYLGFSLFEIIFLSLVTTIIITFLHYSFSKRFLIFNLNLINKNRFDNIKPILTFTFISLVMIASQNIDILFLSFYATTVEIGIYSLPNALILKSLIIRNAISLGFAPTVIKQMKDGELPPRDYFLYSFYVFILVGFGSVALSLFSPQVISLFGDNFSSSESVFRILVFTIPFLFATIPFVLFLQSTSNEFFILLSVALSLLARVILHFKLYSEYDYLGVAYSSIVSNFISLALLSYFTFYLLKRTNKQVNIYG